MNKKDKLKSAFIFLLKRDDVEVVEKQIPARFYIDATDSRGDTALVISVKNNSLNCIKYLLSQHANILVKDCDGLTLDEVVEKYSNIDVKKYFDTLKHKEIKNTLVLNSANIKVLMAISRKNLVNTIIKTDPLDLTEKKSISNVNNKANNKSYKKNSQRENHNRVIFPSSKKKQLDVISDKDKFKKNISQKYVLNDKELKILMENSQKRIIHYLTKRKIFESVLDFVNREKLNENTVPFKPKKIIRKKKSKIKYKVIATQQKQSYCTNNLTNWENNSNKKRRNQLLLIAGSAKKVKNSKGKNDLSFPLVSKVEENNTDYDTSNIESTCEKNISTDDKLNLPNTDINKSYLDLEDENDDLNFDDFDSTNDDLVFSTFPKEETGLDEDIYRAYKEEQEEINARDDLSNSSGLNLEELFKNVVEEDEESSENADNYNTDKRKKYKSKIEVSVSVKAKEILSCIIQNRRATYMDLLSLSKALDKDMNFCEKLCNILGLKIDSSKINTYKNMSYELFSDKEINELLNEVTDKNSYDDSPEFLNKYFASKILNKPLSYNQYNIQKFQLIEDSKDKIYEDISSSSRLSLYWLFSVYISNKEFHNTDFEHRYKNIYDIVRNFFALNSFSFHYCFNISLKDCFKIEFEKITSVRDIFQDWKNHDTIDFKKISELFLLPQQVEILYYLGVRDKLIDKELMSEFKRIMKKTFDIRNQIAMMNYHLIYKRLQSMRISWGNPLFDDCFQEGFLGLMYATEKYQLGIASFSTYSNSWIWQKITRFLQNDNLIRYPVHYSETTKVIKKVYNSLCDTSFDVIYPSEKDIVAKLNIKKEEEPENGNIIEKNISHISDFFNYKNTILYNYNFENNDKYHIYDDSIFDIEKYIENKELYQELMNEINQNLKERDANILMCRYGLAPFFEEYTLSYLGNFYGITRERVRQIENKDILKLQKSMIRNKYISYFE